VILCHLSGLTAAGYTYVSIEITSVIYDNYCKYIKKKQFFFKFFAVKKFSTNFAFPLILLHLPNPSVYKLKVCGTKIVQKVVFH